MPALRRGPTTIGVDNWAANLTTVLSTLLTSVCQRLNGSLHEDGRVRMQAPLLLAEYAEATLPDATQFPGGLIFVSDGASGQKLRYSDGTTWVDIA